MAVAWWKNVRLGNEGLLVRDSPEALCCVTHQRHCVVSLSKTLYPLLSTGSNHEDGKRSQHDEKMLTETKIIKTNISWSHAFVEIDQEINFMVILLPSTESFKKGCCQLQAKYVHEVLVNCLFKLA